MYIYGTDVPEHVCEFVRVLVRHHTDRSYLKMEDIPTELLPYKGRLSPRFFEARKEVNDFIQHDVLPNLPEWNRQRRELEEAADHPTLAPMPPMHWHLMERAKARKIFNFFLPEVCGLSVLEYAPIQEVLGTVPQANFAMNCSAPDTG